MNTCCCEFGNGNPLIRDHSQTCKIHAQVEKLIEECDKELGNRDWDTEWNDGVKTRYMTRILELTK